MSVYFTPSPKKPKKTTATFSPFFDPPSPLARPPRGTISVIKVPSTSAPKFGLIQEELSSNPFQLLVAVIFLNRTRASVALPYFQNLIKKYPTPQLLSKVPHHTLAQTLQPLGINNRRAATLLRLANAFLTNPPTATRRYTTRTYPYPDSSTPASTTLLSPADTRLNAWEIAHIKGLGRYAFDSWRIFCRDELCGLACGWDGEGTDQSGLSEPFEPEWKRVHPHDKELKAFIKWCWLREGMVWDSETGEKRVATEDELTIAAKGELEIEVEEEEEDISVVENYDVPLKE